MSTDIPAMAAAACTLCSLRAATGLSREFSGEPKPFCCAGCANVYAILVESGIAGEGGDLRESELYRQSLKLGLVSRPEAAARAIPAGAATQEALYRISGMWCASCAWLVEHALNREYGVTSAEVLFTSDLLKVTFCPQYVEPGRIPARVATLGYRAKEYTGDGAERHDEWRDIILRLGLAGFLWMNVMLFSLVIYASYFEGISEWARRAVPFILVALAGPVVFYSAWPVHRIAWHGLREGAIRMEALISSGVFAAYLYSTIQAFQGGRHVYFDTACAIVTLVLAGKALERGAKEKTARAIGMLYRLMPKKARLAEEGRERFVAIEAVEPGMTLLVKPGERIPADGVVVEGGSQVDESVVTGESTPLEKHQGDTVLGGSLNGAGVLRLLATHPAAQSTLQQIVHSVEGALASRMPLERAVDRISRIFVPGVMLIALATVGGGTLLGLEFTEALMRGIAVVVIACPCALGLATPLATTAAIGAASHRGILIRDARVLETIHGIDVLLLDKTGTATEGRFLVRESLLAPDVADADPLCLLASVEANSEHPVAAALISHAAALGVQPRLARDIEIERGGGIRGQVGGVRVAAGTRRYLAGHGIALTDPIEAAVREWEEAGLTAVFFALDGVCAGAFGLGDQPRPEAPRLIAALRERGVRTVILSGDSAAATARMAARLGASEFRGEVPPAGKAAAVREYQQQGALVAMAGDGINDAPALAAADLGIAMGSGADLAMQAAPVVLMNGSLLRLAETFDLARFTLRVVRQNLFWAFFYNSIGISLSVAGVLTPILAAAAMVFSSLSVIGNSLRLRVRDAAAYASHKS
ncbi:MAG: heavy metal translocating P-type ATPase [Bryobacterales bacterium]|nr:heavy metal translocating P-type ATPase [Bryobacterales bacterium]